MQLKFLFNFFLKLVFEFEIVNGGVGVHDAIQF